MSHSPTNPLVTAVIRTFNRENLLPCAIDSVLAQTYKNFELIILDDCSTDNTPQVVKTYLAADSRIRYIRHERNMGTGKGFNTVNAAARGQYLAYLDDDDTWRPDKLAQQIAKFQSCPPTVGLLTAGVQYTNSDTGRPLRTWIPSRKGDLYWQSLGTSGDLFGPPSVVMIPKAVLDDIGPFREDMPRGCCQQYFRRLAKKYHIDFVPDVLLDYAVHKNAITAITSPQDILNCITSLQIKIDSTRDDLQQVPHIYADELIKLGHYHCLSGQMPQGRACFRQAARLGGMTVPLVCYLLGSTVPSALLYKIAGRCCRPAQVLTRRLGKGNHP